MTDVGFAKWGFSLFKFWPWMLLRFLRYGVLQLPAPILLKMRLFLAFFLSDSCCLTLCSRHWCQLFWNDTERSDRSLWRVRLGQKRPGLQGHHAVPKLSRDCHELHDRPRDVHQIEAPGRKRTGTRLFNERVSLSNLTPRRNSSEVHGGTHFTFY